MFNHNSDQDHPQGPTGCILHIDLTDALSRLSCPNATFGTLFFSESLGRCCSSGASQIGEVTFTTHILGKFPEDLQLTVTGQPELSTVTFGKSLWVFKLERTYSFLHVKKYRV